ncbi:hypothetical protein BS78_01G049500 [Paspalum vaginatum]|nr:hypothetical protein BS78_01G049500 [Paspalum vaginatum]
MDTLRNPRDRSEPPRILCLKNTINIEHPHRTAWIGCPALSSRERVVVDPERGVHADDGRGDEEGDEEVEPGVDERLPLAAAEVEAQPGDEERQEDEHGHGAVDEAEEDEHERGQRVVGAEVGEVPARPRAGLPAAVRARERRRVQHLPPRARPPRRRPRERPSAGEEGNPGLRRRRRSRSPRRRRGRRLAARPVHLPDVPRLERRRRRGRGGDGSVARPRRGGGGHGGRWIGPRAAGLNLCSGRA